MEDVSDTDNDTQGGLYGKNSKKQRKPYTITKPRESWNDEEHQKFIEALKLYERDWKKIESYVGTKTAVQIRSHAQKYFIKMQKLGKRDQIPPPRPKRKSDRPYPKDPRSRDKKRSRGGDDDDSGAISGPQSPDDSIGDGASYGHQNMRHIDPMLLGGYPDQMVMPDMGMNLLPYQRPASFPDSYNLGAVNNVDHALMNPSMQWTLWERNQLVELQQEQLCQAQYYLQQSLNNSPVEENNVNQESQNTKVPNFQKIYSFLGSLFDPSATEHVEELRKMDPIDREVIQLLMENLAVNLSKHNSNSDFDSVGIKAENSRSDFRNPSQHYPGSNGHNAASSHIPVSSPSNPAPGIPANKQLAEAAGLLTSLNASR